jgi:RNA polymerase sigma-70 factor (ECF subfamily)
MAATTTAAPYTAWQCASRAEEPRTWQREFEEVALVHRERLYRLALGLCRNRTDAEDLVQEALLRAFRRFDRFTPGTNCLAWLATILRNIFINQVTRQGRLVLLGDDDALERAVADWESGPKTPTPEKEFLRHVIDDRRLAEALERLPRRLREVLLLADVEELSYREIAQRCELPIGTVMSRLFRARRHIRKALTFEPAAARSDGGRRRMRKGSARLSLRKALTELLSPVR